MTRFPDHAPDRTCALACAAWRLRLAAPALLLALAACGGGSSGSGSEGGGSTPPATAPLARMTTLAAGTACVGGGLVVQAGHDQNGNAALDDAEVSLTATVCNGSAGTRGAAALARFEAESAGALCALGGAGLVAGRDADGNGVLDASEVEARSVLCRGADGQPAGTRLHAVTPLGAGDAACPHGGSRLAGGFDRNGNGMLDADEITDAQFACHAAAGAPGNAPHPTLVALADDPGCAGGGTLVLAGLDADGNGTLDAAEVTSRQSVCSGRAGATGAAGGLGAPTLMTLADEPPGAACLAGGVRLAAGADLDRNGVLDAGEVTSARTVCNGLAGAQAAGGARSLVAARAEAPGAACPAGGQRLDAGVDLNVDGVLDAAEITSTAFVCRGATGAAGTAGLASLVRIAGRGACAQGGSGQLVSSGRDADRNGVLDDAEVAASELVCPGSAGATGTAGTAGAVARVAMVGVGASAQCPAGGRRLDAGIDADGNGVLDAGEVADSVLVCNGIAGAEFTWNFPRTASVQMLADNGYFLSFRTDPYVLTLPAAPAVGSTVRVDALIDVPGWIVAQNAGQRIVTTQAGDAVARRDSHLGALVPVGGAGSWRGLALSADGRLVTGVLADAKIRISRDGGQTWFERDSARAWSAVAGSADGERYVAAENGGRLYTSSDGGINWTARESVRVWRAVAASRNGLTLVAAAANDQIYTSTDGGVNWTAREAARNWSAVAVSPDGTHMAAAERGGRIHVSDDGGQSWTARETAREWVALAISPEGSTFVALDRTSGLHLSKDGGASWLARGPAGTWSAGAVSDSLGRLLIAAEDGTLMRSDDAGHSWRAAGSAGGAVAPGALALSADGLDAMLAADGLAPRRSEAWRGVYATTEGTGGSLRGGWGSRAELQYLGNGEWLLKSWSGSLLAE